MPLELGARASQPARALRSYENPNLSFLGQPRTMAEAYVGTPNANGTVLWKDNAGAHANLGVANQALGILLRGPAIHGLDMTLDAPLPWSDVKRLYLPLLTERAPDEADVPKGVWTLHGMAVSMRRTAEKAKMDVGAVLCAWAAVGVLSPKDLGKFDTSRCHGFVPTTVSPPKSSELCKGRSDGVYCSADVAIGAIACVGGTAKAGRQCPSRSVCDPRMDGDSDIRCYNRRSGRRNVLPYESDAPRSSRDRRVQRCADRRYQGARVRPAGHRRCRYRWRRCRSRRGGPALGCDVRPGTWPDFRKSPCRRALRARPCSRGCASLRSSRGLVGDRPASERS